MSLHNKMQRSIRPKFYISYESNILGIVRGLLSLNAVNRINSEISYHLLYRANLLFDLNRHYMISPFVQKKIMDYQTLRNGNYKTSTRNTSETMVIHCKNLLKISERHTWDKWEFLCVNSRRRGNVLQNVKHILDWVSLKQNQSFTHNRKKKHLM